MKNILLIGPGNSIIDFKIPKAKNYTIISFSGVFNWFVENQIIPDYWTFLDPNSIFLLLDNFNKLYVEEYFNKVKNKTTLIYNDIQGTPKFYEMGFTTPRGVNWNSDNKFQTFKEYFKSIEILKTDIKLNSLEVSKEKHNIIVHKKGKNICKFSSYLLPLIYHKFSKVNNIDVIGFGDYKSPRAYHGSSEGYGGYKSSFDLMMETHKKYLKENNINIRFLNNNSYYKKLEWKK